MACSAIQTLDDLKIASLEGKIGSTESINRTLRVMTFTKHTALKVSPTELHQNRELN